MNGQQDDFSDPAASNLFTQADQLQLQRYQAALSGIRQDQFQGNLSADDATQMEQGVQAAMQPLTQRQQAQQNAQKQAAYQQAHEQAAMAASINQQNQNYAADSFDMTTRSYTDPETGATAHFYQKGGPGQWEQMDLAPEESAAEASPDTYLNQPQESREDIYGIGTGLGKGAGGDWTPLDQALLGVGDVAGATPFGVGAGFPGLQSMLGRAPGEPKVKGSRQTSDGSHEMTIVNGDQEEVWRFPKDPNSPTGFGPAKLVRSGTAESGTDLSAQQAAAIRRQAWRMVKDMAPGPHQQAAYAHLVTQMSASAVRDKEHRRLEKAREAAATKKEEAARARQEAAANKERTEQQVTSSVERHTKQVHDEIAKWRSDLTLKGQQEPAWFNDPTKQEAEIERRVLGEQKLVSKMLGRETRATTNLRAAAGTAPAAPAAAPAPQDEAAAKKAKIEQQWNEFGLRVARAQEAARLEAEKAAAARKAQAEKLKKESRPKPMTPWSKIDIQGERLFEGEK